MKSGVLLLCVVAAAFLAAVVKGDAFGVCTFQNSDETVTGYFTFQQVTDGGDVTVVANFTTHTKVKKVYLHFHTYGDIELTENGYENECYTTSTLGPYEGSGKTTTFLSTTWTSGINLFGSDSIIGRSAALYESKSSCSKGLSATPLAQCVVGLRNVAAITTNEGGLYLDEEPVAAYGRLVHTTGNSGVNGHIFFVPLSDGDVYVYLKVAGLGAKVNHAVHVHIWGDITSSDGLSAGGHFNPNDGIHGMPPSLTRHMGDMGNITTNKNGEATLEDTFNLLSLISADGNIMGRTFIIHALGDDGNPTNSTTSTGSAGARLARAPLGVTKRLPASYTSEKKLRARIAYVKAKRAARLLSQPSPVADIAEAMPAVADASPVLAEASPALADPTPAEAPPTPALAAEMTATTTTTRSATRKQSKTAAEIALEPTL